MRRFIAALVLLGGVAVGVTGCNGTPQSPQATRTTTSHGAATHSSAPAAAPRQTVLPLTGLENPQDVAVDTEGNVYVADLHQGKDDKGFPAATTRVIKLAAGSDNQTVLPFPDLGMHDEIQAVDVAGNAYGTNGGGVDPNGACCLAVHVVKLAAGSDTPTELPLKDVNGIGGMAVDTAGDVYVGDYDHNQVLKLAAGSDAPTVLPFKNVHGIVDVAVDSEGSVYVVDADHNRVLKLAAGSDTPTVLPFEGIKKPIRMTVDTAGSVYLIDGGNRSVLKLAAEGS